jgi:serine/threonine-protein kinase
MVGQRLGNWLLTDKLGKGGMAVVYKAIPHDSLNTAEAVAIKVINRDNLQNPESKARFEREVRIGAKLNHPNIIRIIDWDVGGPYYLVMELIDGFPMRKRVLTDGMAPRLALDLMMPVFDAMIYAHEQGVWHRDLKPENIFISRGNRLTVMDFGISRQATDVTVTGTDQMPVTPGYMSPEQFSGKGVAAASDQYTLGIMMWELIVGHRPFEDDSPLVVVMKHVGTPLPSMREEKPDVPEEVDWVIDRMCSKDPLQRYPDLQSAVQALEEAIHSG